LKPPIKSNVEKGLVDRICQTFTTTDDSHHSEEAYQADRQRILRYHSWVYELAKELD
jgi:hypothetical protein